MTSRHPGFPLRAALRPGARVCRRSATELQVGLSPERSVVLPDDASVRLVLRGLADGQPPPPPADLPPRAVQACARLLAHDLIVDADAWCSVTDGLTGTAGQARSALVAESGDGATARLAARRTVRVAVEARGLDGASARLSTLLEQAALAVVPRSRASVVAVLAEGEPERAHLDELVREDLPHVLLVVHEGAVRGGPFVHPGLTACQRCLDAHAAERDPRHALLLEQCAGPSTTVWGLPAPVPGDLVTVGIGLLARDLTRWADVLPPATWSTTIRIDPALELPRTTWSRHAACGCSSNSRTA